MRKSQLILSFVTACCVLTPALAQDPLDSTSRRGVFTLFDQPQDEVLRDPMLAAADPAAPTTIPDAPATAPAPPSKAAPLPFHTIEGYGGGAITPMAYLVNPGPKGTVLGLPSLSATYVGMDRKGIVTTGITETLFGRIELGFSAEHLALGTLPGDIKKATTVDIGHDDLWLYNFNLRGLVIEENSFELPLPALTFGVHVKYNDTIGDINHRLGNALRTIGYRKDWGVDFTQTFTKMFPEVFGRPLIVSAGLRESEGSNTGFLGFADTYDVTFEGNIAYLPTDWLVIAYEYRGKPHAFGSGLDPLIKEEDDWHGIDVSWIINNHATLVVGYSHLGEVANASANTSWWVQFKYEF